MKRWKHVGWHRDVPALLISFIIHNSVGRVTSDGPVHGENGAHSLGHFVPLRAQLGGPHATEARSTGNHSGYDDAGLRSAVGGMVGGKGGKFIDGASNAVLTAVKTKNPEWGGYADAAAQGLNAVLELFRKSQPNPNGFAGVMPPFRSSPYVQIVYGDQNSRVCLGKIKKYRREVRKLEKKVKRLLKKGKRKKTESHNDLPPKDVADDDKETDGGEDEDDDDDDFPDSNYEA